MSPVTAVDALGHTVHYDYDSEHHLIGTTLYPEAGKTIQTGASYYPNGLVHTLTDGLSTPPTTLYDGFGLPETRQTASEPATITAYDPIGRMTGLTDPAGSATSFDYDNRGLLLSRTDPLGRTAAFSYYNDGRLSARTDRNGHTVSYSYTQSGKVEEIAYPGGASVHFTYDQRDNCTGMEDALGSTTYAYDGVNRLISSTDPHGFTVSYAYDGAGNCTALTYPGARRVLYTYDALNRLETVTIEWLGEQALYHYDGAGRVTGVDQFNGTRVDYSYDNANRMTVLANTRTDGSAIAVFTFTLDANGQRTRIEETTPLELQPSEGVADYTYNAEKNRLLAAGSASFTYDLEGQLQTGYGNTCAFDYEHRLASAGTSSYFYDGAGRRLRAVKDGATTRYIYDAVGNLLAEADGSNNITRLYIYGQGLLAMATPSNALYCYHFNAVGSTMALTDQSQTIVNQYAYTPFGEITGEVEGVVQPFKYVGQFGVMAESNGLYYMRARYYDPQVGRFISEDPIGFDGGDVNLYAYVRNNPVMGIDPQGLLTLYYGGGVAAYNSYERIGTVSLPRGSAVGSAGGILTSDNTPILGANFVTVGYESYMREGKINTVGGGAGVGPLIGFMTGSIDDFKGLAHNTTIDVGIASVTFTKNDAGAWGLSVSSGGRGIGLGAYSYDTMTDVYGSCNR
jgi:RHS repeat-associated protein